MQHIIELDYQAEKDLSELAMHAHKSKFDTLLTVVKRYLRQQLKRSNLEEFLKPYQVNFQGYTFARDAANEC